MQVITSIQNRICKLRGEGVMKDKDLAALYEIEIKMLNQAVKRRIKRVSAYFMFQLTKEEYASINFQLNNANFLRSQFVTLKNSRGKHLKHLPYAFAEQGVAMLSGILNSGKAINMNVAIMRAFVAVRKKILYKTDIKQQLLLIKERIGEDATQLSQIYDAMENLLDEKASQKKWEEREWIGFKN